MEEKTIGTRIEKMRNIWRLSKEDLSKKIGISLNDYDKLSSGSLIPDMSLAMKLCDALKISLDYLMNGVETEKDKQSINRPLSKEERISDKLDEVKRKYSPRTFEKFKKYLYAIYIDRNDKQNGIWLGNDYGVCHSVDYIKLNDFEFFKELCENGVFDLHYEMRNHYPHDKSKSIDEVLSFDKVFDLMKERCITDEDFISYAIKCDPVKVLNYYYLTDDKISDKKGILNCLNVGGYVEKCVNIRYYDDGEGNSSKEYEFGKDSFATMLLKEYCLKK